MKTGLSISYSVEGMRDINLLDFFHKNVSFTPLTLSKNLKGGRWKSDVCEKMLKSFDIRDNCSMVDRTGNFFDIATNESTLVRTITIEQDMDIKSIADYDLEMFLSKASSLVSIYLYNADYSIVQSTESETVWADKDIDPEIFSSLRNTPFSVDMFGKRVYDVRNNPGRVVFLDRTNLIAAWKMWFGKSFFELVPKSRILSFRYADNIVELNEDLVFVELFKNVAESHTVDNMFAQLRWQEWIGFDEMEQKYAWWLR